MLNFKELRKRYGYTIEAVALATGLSVGTIHYAENGIDMKLSTYNKLSDFYKSQENKKHSMDINVNLNVNFPQLDKMYELLFQILEEAKKQEAEKKENNEVISDLSKFRNM